MNLKDGIRAAGSAGIAQLLTGLKRKRTSGRFLRVVVSALTLVGATAIGWAIRRAVRPKIAARKMHRNIKGRLVAGRPAAPGIARKVAA
jgi:hypothetical protein